MRLAVTPRSLVSSAKGDNRAGSKIYLHGKVKQVTYLDIKFDIFHRSVSAETAAY